MPKIIVNLTPHSIQFVDWNNQVIQVVPPSGTLARCTSQRQKKGEINGIPINSTSFGDVTGLPDPVPNTIFIVSAITAQAVKDTGGREDVFITDDAVRDPDGKIIGCRALAQV